MEHKHFNKKFDNETVQSKYDILKNYDECETLSQFDIVHIYKTDELCFPDGYYDAQWFELIIFNSNEKKYQKLKRQFDGLTFLNNSSNIHIRVFCDGSIFIRFLELKNLNTLTQELFID